MDKKFIKNNKEFPAEVRGAFKKKSAQQTNHSASVLWWIIGLLALLVIVFFIGLWAGRLTTELVEDRSNAIEQERRQEVVNQQQLFTNTVTEEERSERLRGFFGE
jgi:type VI protein secretion system component VasF